MAANRFSMDKPDDIEDRSDEGEDVKAFVCGILRELINTAVIPKNDGSDVVMNNSDVVAEGENSKVEKKLDPNCSPVHSVENCSHNTLHPLNIAL